MTEKNPHIRTDTSPEREAHLRVLADQGDNALRDALAIAAEARAELAQARASDPWFEVQAAFGLHDGKRDAWLALKERAERAEAALAKLTAASVVPHSEVQEWLLGGQSRASARVWAEVQAAAVLGHDGKRDIAQWQTAEAEQRAERAEAERDAMRAALAEAEESADLVLRHEDRTRLEAERDAARAMVRAAQSSLEMVAEHMTEHAYQELASALDSPPRSQSASVLADLAAAHAQLAAVVAAVGEVLSRAGCSCDCDHDAESHDADCERCLGCDVEAAMRAVLADPAQAAREHDERVRAEAARRAAEIMFKAAFPSGRIAGTSPQETAMWYESVSAVIVERVARDASE